MAVNHLQSILRRLERMAVAPGHAGLSDVQLLERHGRGDRDALDILVRRHGALVWRVCRRVLGRKDVAEDAFQATFLVLASKASSIRKPASLASWLHGVAVRIARRARLERSAVAQAEPFAGEEANPSREVAARELAGIIEEEVAALPERFRAPILLCYWEGRTNEEAARLLGVEKGTVKSRLARARQVLHRRLLRRGVTFPAGVVAVLLAPASLEGGLPPFLLGTTLRALGEGSTLPPCVAAETSLAASLANTALRGMALSKLKLGAIVVFIGSLAAAASELAFRSLHAHANGPDTAQATAGSPTPGPRPAKVSAPLLDRFGDPLPPGALLRLGTTRFRSATQMSGSVAFAPSGKTLLSSDANGIGFFDLPTGKKLRILPVSSRESTRFSLSPDGKILASADWSIIGIWEISTGKELRRLRGGSGSLAFSHDGKTLASTNPDGLVTLWDWSTGKDVLQINTKQFQLDQVGFSHDDRVVYSLSSREAFAWDASSGKRLLHIPYPKIRFWCTYLDKLVLSQDGKLLARSVFTEPVRLYETATGREIGLVQINGARLGVESFTPDGKGLFLSGQEGTELWDLARGKRVYRLAASGLPAFSQDGKTVAFPGGMLALYDLASGKQLNPSAEPRAATERLLFTADGRRLLSLGERLRVWDARTGKLLHAFPGHTWYSLAVAPDGNRVAWGDSEGRVYVGDSNTGTCLQSWNVVKQGIPMESMSFSLDGRKLFTLGSHGAPDKKRSVVIQVWESATGKELSKWENAADFGTPAALSPDGRTIVLAEGNRWLLRDASRGREIAEIRPSPGRFPAFSFSVDGKTLAASTGQLWETATGIELWPASSGIGRIAFSRDGRLLASGNDNAISVWDVATGRELFFMRGHDVPVRSLAFSPDARTLASGLADTTVLIWDLSRCPRPKLPPPDVRDLEGLWTDLGSRDGPKVQHAFWTLALNPEHAVPLLRERLRPVSATEWKRLQQLVVDLDSGTFTIRQRAYQELQRRAFEAEPLLLEVLSGEPSPEVRRRAGSLLRSPRHLEGPDLLRTLRGIQILEHLATPSARTILAALAEGAPQSTITREAREALRGRLQR